MRGLPRQACNGRRQVFVAFGHISVPRRDDRANITSSMKTAFTLESLRDCGPVSPWAIIGITPAFL
ncbi:hypothetical protein BSQ44_17445 [Aquibium oceanicum]|uniref:Uncharacterized protein n=1 Tax=Aquibium oceanicum TaxID=1670800 RepID=A0A1L3SUB4_9HYPH|nr:hypothetical protein BSQ44_17445 [Aquibium oceanicum]